jgi:hypothetical protein
MKLRRKLEQALPSAARIEELEPFTIEWSVKPVGAERIRQLLGGDAGRGTRAEPTTLRWFEVRQVVLGRGLWLAETFPRGRYGDPFWVEDPEASQYFEAGNFFGGPMRPNDRVTVPRAWEHCEECRRSMRRA